jgi:hypothetical protein
MFVLGPDVTNTTSDAKLSNIGVSKTGAKDEDYTVPKLDAVNTEKSQNPETGDQEADEHDNPYEEDSTTNRIKNDPGKKITTEETLDAAKESKSDSYPGYVPLIKEKYND